MTHADFSLASATDAARRGETAMWVGDFLASRGSDNEILAAALALEEHWWLGPLRLPLADLQRLAGPEDDVECPIDEDEWEHDLDSMESSLEDGWEPPPLLVEYDASRLLLQDGNHRYEALQRAGATEAWVLIYFADPADRDQFAADRPRST
jgi:hypothetical protein